MTGPHAPDGTTDATTDATAGAVPTVDPDVARVTAVPDALGRPDGTGRPTLADALDDAVTRLREASALAEAAHEHYTRLLAADRSWRRVDTAVADGIRQRRTEVALYAAAQLADALAAEADDARARFPDIGREGDILPSAPPSQEPADVARWWAGLDDDGRRLVVERSTAWVGRADGLPLAVRHAANVEVLDAEIARREAVAEAVARAEPRAARAADPYGIPHPDLSDRVTGGVVDVARTDADLGAEREERDLRGLHVLGAALAEDDERRLYLLDARRYPLKCAVAIGDVDAATHVVVHVPGATTTVEQRLDRELQWMTNLRDEMARLLPEDARIAVVDWIGYQAPYDIAVRRALGDSGMKVFVPGEASDDRYARDAAPHLARAVAGLRVLRPDARLTASGHSYGASTLGLALRAPHTVDAVMVTGCPGLFTSSLADLGLDVGQLYVGVAGGDLVASLGLFGGHPLRIPGSVMLSPLARAVTYPDGRKALLKLVVGHESYYNAGTEMLHNLAAVAAGSHERVRALRGARG